MMLIMNRTMKKADVDDSQSVQLGGVAYVTDQKFVMFCPGDPVPGVVEPFVMTGKGQLMRMMVDEKVVSITIIYTEKKNG